MYFLIYRNIAIGGIETLILREARWVNEHIKNKSMVLCHKLSEQMKSSFEAAHVDYKILSTWSPNEISKELYRTKSVEMIKYFSFEDYLNFVIRNPGLFENCRSMYHCVHPLNAIILKSHSSLRGGFWRALAKVTKYMIETNRFRFMDEETLNQTLQYYEIEVKKSYSENYLRIPYLIKELPFKSLDVSGNRNILAIARAEFPFKGYLLGLVKTMPEIMEKYPCVSLTVISSGDNVDRLENEINQLQEKYKMRISLHKDKKPEELDIYYREADIFVGMGTTVLEAANYGIPIIMAKPYTEEFISDGFFHIAPTDIGNFSLDGKPGQDDVFALLNTRTEQWEAIQQITKQQLIAYYDIEEVMKQSMSAWDKKVSINAIKKDLNKVKLLMQLKQIKKH